LNKKDITIGYACLDCRKTFKKHKYTQDKRGNWVPVEYAVVCPQCSSHMYETGSAFKAPKSLNIKEWDKLSPLFKSGYKFNPDFGSPFEESSQVKPKRQLVPKSEFRA
jgi:hypothetical protein